MRVHLRRRYSHGINVTVRLKEDAVGTSVGILRDHVNPLDPTRGSMDKVAESGIYVTKTLILRDCLSETRVEQTSRGG